MANSLTDVYDGGSATTEIPVMELSPASSPLAEPKSIMNETSTKDRTKRKDRRVRFVEPIKTPSSERRLLRRFAAMRPLATPPKSNGFLPISYSLKRLRRSVSFDRGELHRPKDKFLDCSPIANELTPKEASPAGLRTLLKSPIVPSGLDLLLNSPILSDSESNLDSSQESLDISDCSQDC